MNIDDETTEHWDHLIETGALVRTGGTDEEPEYGFNLPVLEVVNPVLYQVYLDELDELVFSLVGKGFLDIMVASDGEYMVELTPKGKAAADALKVLGYS